MTSWITSALAFALAWLPAAHGENPLVLGAVVSQSGPLAELAADYRKALLLWQEQVNAGGGLLGRRIELRLLDDASSAPRNAQLYDELIRDKADALIGPYGSAASLMAAAEAERARRVIVNGSAPARALHRRAPRYVFQASVPYSAFGERAVEAAKDAGMKSVFIVTRDDPGAREMAEAARQAALELGLKTGEIEIYSGGAADFAPQIARARAAQADAWLDFGEARDAAATVRSFKKLGYAPKFFFARAAADPKFVAFVGQDAEFTLAALEYDTRLETPGNAEFVKAFSAKWSVQPGPAAAEGYAAATVIAQALQRAAIADQEKLRSALSRLEIETVLGPYKVDPSGAQVATKPALVQIGRGKPQLLAAGSPPAPYPQWNERKRLK